MPSELRKGAEEKLKAKTIPSKVMSDKENRQLIHELQVHQIELEMQNDELRKAQAEIEESRAKYADLYDFAPVGYFTLDKHGLILEANLTAAKALGVERSGLIDKPFRTYIVTEDRSIFDQHFLKVFKSSNRQTCEIRLKEKDGKEFYAQLESIAVNDLKGNSLCRSSVINITLRKQAEEELQKAYDELDLRVKERTAELTRANEQFLQVIEDRKQAANSLREALTIIKQLKDQLYAENIYLKEEINLMHSHKDIVGNTEAIKTVLNQIEQVAPTDSTVLILGETGTGKELLAHAIHNMSARKSRLMIKVNCAALPPTLIESELFGREKGAFTGSLSKQIGRFELADASTIFLDEIDTLPLELQSKLLRVLESGEFERLGSPRTVKVDVRIISATNRDLAGVVRDGGFREDLYYRLNIFGITVPPLRERREDILPLVWSFVQEFSKRMGKRIESIPQKCIKALQAYPWPGNVRELRNITERAMIITTGPVLNLDVPQIVQSGANQSGTLEELEKQIIIKALNTTGWRVSGKGGAAEILAVNPKTLESMIKKLGIERSKKNS